MHFCHSSGERKDVYRLQALGQSEDLLADNLSTNLVKEKYEINNWHYLCKFRVSTLGRNMTITTEIFILVMSCSVPQMVNHWGSVPKNTLNRPKLTKITVQW